MVYSCTQGQLVDSSSGPCSSSAGRNVKETHYFSLLQDASLSEEWVFPAAGHTSTQRNVAEREYKCMRQKAAVQDLNWDKSIGKEASWSTKPGMGRRQKQQKCFGTTYYQELENRSLSHRVAKTSYLWGSGAKQNRCSSWGRRTLHVLLLATATCWPVGF